MTPGWELAFKVIGVALPVFSIIYTIIATRRKDLEARLHAGSERIDGLELRIQSVEQTVRDMPGRSDLHQVAIAMAEMGGDMKAMQATLMAMADSVKRTEGIVSRHEDYLREKT